MTKHLIFLCWGMWNLGSLGIVGCFIDLVNRENNNTMLVRHVLKRTMEQMRQTTLQKETVKRLLNLSTITSLGQMVCQNKALVELLE